MNELKTTRKFNKNADVKLIDKREVLGKEFRVYGTVEEPLFLAKDVAEWIDYSWTNSKKTARKTGQMLETIDEEEKLKACIEVKQCSTPSPHGGLRENTEMWFLTEDGLYEVLMQSRKPIAKHFKKEVKAILKQIRLTGGMVVENREEEFINNYFPSFSEEVKLAMVQDLRQQNTLLKQKVEEQRPKVEYHDRVLNSDKLITTTDVAKDLGMSARKLHNVLHEKGIIYRQGTNWKLYAKYEDRVPTYCDYVINEYSQQLKWTEKGRKWIIDVLA